MSSDSRNVTAENFDQAVLEASHETPVLVDFWAPWCAPCRALAPVLDRLEKQYQGKFRLAKVNTDEEPELATRFGIRGIPNVKAFVGGKIVSDFSGALPEPAVRAFLDRLIPGPAEKLRLSALQALREGEFETAESRLQEALKLDPGHGEARLDLAELLVARQAFTEADMVLAQMPEREREERARQLASQIEFWKKGQSLPEAAELAAAVNADPGNLELRLRLADRHVADRSFESALEQLIEVVRKDRGELRDRARKTMVEVFGLAQDQAEMISRYRRLLASALY